MIFFPLAQIHWGNLTQLNFSWRTDRGILYKYCYLGHTSIYLVHVPGCTYTLLTRVLERARTLSLAPSQSCYYPQGFAARSYVVNRLDTDLTTKLARCLRRRDDNRPTLSMTWTHTITYRRQNSLREAILPVFISCVPSCTAIENIDQWGREYRLVIENWKGLETSER